MVLQDAPQLKPKKQWLLEYPMPIADIFVLVRQIIIEDACAAKTGIFSRVDVLTNAGAIAMQLKKIKVRNFGEYMK